jgi:hypothetical protein
MFTDIADATSLVAQLGDAGRRDLPFAHHRVVDDLCMASEGTWSTGLENKPRSSLTGAPSPSRAGSKPQPGPMAGPTIAGAEC